MSVHLSFWPFMIVVCLSTALIVWVIWGARKGRLEALASLSFLGLVGWAVFCLASGKLEGFVDAPQKDVTLNSSPNTASSDLTLVVQPPMATTQLQGESQLLTLELSNHTDTALTLTDLTAQPSPCFAIEKAALAPATQKPFTNVEVGKRSTVVILASLTFKNEGSCLGPHPLALMYSWKPDCGCASAPLQTRTISTSPIFITTHERHVYERVVRILQLMVVPLLVVIATFLFQRHQTRRDELQNDQNLSTEVWKVIHPIFFDLVRKFYLPLVRTTLYAADSLVDAKTDATIVAAYCLMLRKQMSGLMAQQAGYYFQSKRGEDLCVDLAAAFLYFTDSRTEKKFSIAVNQLVRVNFKAPDLGAQEIANKLKDSAEFKAVVDVFKAPATGQPAVTDTLPARKFLIDLLKIYRAVLEFECDRPFYLKWYDKKEPPKFPMEVLKVEKSWVKGPDWEDREAMGRSIAAYRATIPRVSRDRTKIQPVA